jgi:RNA polymerase sigma factor (sigma-70 family)
VTRKHKSHAYFPSGIEWILLEEVRRGNKSAYIYLFRGYLWFIKKLARVYTPKGAAKIERNRVLACVAEIFKTCAHTMLLDESSCFLEYVLNTTKSQFGVEVVRRKRAKKLQDITDAEHYVYTISLDSPIAGTDNITLSETVPSHEVSAERAVYLAQLQELVPQILSNLTVEERTIITRHLLEDLPFKSIAQELGMTTTRVTQKFGKIMRKLRHSLKLRT